MSGTPSVQPVMYKNAAIMAKILVDIADLPLRNNDIVHGRPTLAGAQPELTRRVNRH